MYHNYFGLSEPPFSIAVDPRYLYLSERHRDALAHLVYGVGEGGGFMLLTGEVGTGKTTIIRCLLAQLPDNTDLALVLNPTLSTVELLATVCGELAIEGVDDDSSLKQLTDALHRFLLRNHERGRHTVLLIDEAQHLRGEVLEQIRLLTNLETNTRKLLQIVLVGQPELKKMLARVDLRQLSQRITARYELEPLNRDETQAYIRHRLQVAGLPANQSLFPRRVVHRIHRVSGGIPRLINVLCDRVLLGSYANNHVSARMSVVRQAVAEVRGEGAVKWRPPLVFAVVALACVLLSAAILWQQPWRVATAGSDPVDLSVEPPLAAAAAPQVVAPPPEPPVEQLVVPWYYPDRRDALNALLLERGALQQAADEPCLQLGRQGWRCEDLAHSSWPALLSYNRPAVLEIHGPDKLAAWVALVSLAGQSLHIVGPLGERVLELNEVRDSWTGRVLLPWRPPPGYRGPMRLGATGRAVEWLAQSFARLDGQERALATGVYNEWLERRVSLFQRDEKLLVDGVAGLNTVLRLEQRLGARPLLLAQATLADGAH